MSTGQNHFRAYLAHPVTYPLEAAAGALIYGFFRSLPIKVASDTGSHLGRTLGPHLPVHDVARRNLRRAFPERSEAEISAILEGMWDNLGRTMGEYPHVGRLDPDAGNFVELKGRENLEQARDDNKPGLFLCAHTGNWEIAPLAVRNYEDLTTHLFYRAPNNPLVEWMFRRRGFAGEQLPKGGPGARRALALLKKGDHIGILADQKMNDGMAVPFFGHKAMTAPAIAQFSLKFDAPIFPLQTERLPGPRFRLTAHPPLEVKTTGNRKTDVFRILKKVNETLEGWIRKHPEQWLWVHNRWPKDPSN